MPKISPFYLLGIERNISFKEFEKKVLDRRENWKTEANPEDVDGAIEVDSLIKENVIPLTQEKSWKIYQNSLDSIMMEYKTYKDETMDEEFLINPGKEREDLGEFGDFGDEAFIQTPEFPEVFTGTQKILGYQAKQQKLHLTEQTERMRRSTKHVEKPHTKFNI